MKKLYAVVSLVLALALGMACMSPAMADDGLNFIDFEPQLCNILDMPVSEWMANDTSRALASVCIWLDIATGDSFPYEVKIFQPSYIGYSGEVISVALQLDSKDVCLLALFTPYVGTASYAIVPLYSNLGGFEVQMKEMVSTVCTDGVYQNSETAISDVIDMLSEALSD